MIYGTHDRYAIEKGRLADKHSLDDLPTAVATSVESLRPYCEEFDSIVVMGMSGVVVGAPVALALDVPLVIVRKPTDDAHAYREGGKPYGQLINGDRLGKRACFLDDFTSMGTTRRRVLDAVTARGAEFTVEYLYLGDELRVDGMYVPSTLRRRA